MRIGVDGSLHLSKDDILSYLKNRPPLLMIESAEVRPGEFSCSERLLKDDDWFFACHFPGDPMMPGVLQLESVFNTAALAVKTLEGYRDSTTNVSSISRVHYKRHIRPGERIRIETRVKKFRRGLAFMEGIITSGGKLCCDVEFVLVVLDDILTAGIEQ